MGHWYLKSNLIMESWKTSRYKGASIDKHAALLQKIAPVPFTEDSFGETVRSRPAHENALILSGILFPQITKLVVMCLNSVKGMDPFIAARDEARQAWDRAEMHTWSEDRSGSRGSG